MTPRKLLKSAVGAHPRVQKYRSRKQNRISAPVTESDIPHPAKYNVRQNTTALKIKEHKAHRAYLFSIVVVGIIFGTLAEIGMFTGDPAWIEGLFRKLL